MSRSRVLLWLGLATAAAFMVLAALDVRMRDAGGDGIVALELAGGERDASEILARWGEEGRDAARMSLWFDFVFLALYGCFLALLLDTVRDDWRRWIVVLPLAAALADAVENYELLLFIGGHGTSSAPALATGFALVKFALLAVTLALLAGALVRRRRRASARA